MYKYTPEFERVTSAASAIFGYAFIFPFFISLVLYYSKIMCGFSTVELLTSYGYSLSIFIPISFAWMIPFEFIRWTLVIIGAVISGSVVCLPIWQGLKEVMSNKKIAYAILTIAVAANVALAVGFKMYFFNAPLQSHDGTPINSSQPSLADQVIAEQAIAKDVAPAEPIAPEAPLEPEIPPQAEAQVSEDVEKVEEEPEDIQEAAEETAEETAEDRPERDEEQPEEPVEAVEEAAPEEPAEVPESDQGVSEEEQKVIEVLKELPRAPSPAIIPQSPVVPPEQVQANIVPAAPESNIVPVPAEPDAQVQNSEPAELPEEPAKKPIVLPRVG